MTKMEKILLYPVTIAATVLVLQAWYYQPTPFAAFGTIVVALLWAKPILPVRVQILTRIALLLSIVSLFAILYWNFLWRRI